jgi:hypothetical protein
VRRGLLPALILLAAASAQAPENPPRDLRAIEAELERIQSGSGGRQEPTRVKCFAC